MVPHSTLIHDSHPDKSITSTYHHSINKANSQIPPTFPMLSPVQNSFQQALGVFESLFEYRLPFPQCTSVDEDIEMEALSDTFPALVTHSHLPSNDLSHLHQPTHY